LSAKGRRLGDGAIRRIANTAVGAVVTYVCYVLVLPTILRLIGLYELAAAIDWAGVIYVHPDINYPAIYTFMLILGVAALLAINWGAIAAATRAYRKRNTRIWNWSAVDAIAYIALDTAIGTGLNDHDRINRAIDAFNEFARRGRITVAGRRPGSADIRPIPRRRWRSGQLDFDSIADASRGTGGRMVAARGDNNTVLYEGLMVDKRQLFAAWPRGERPSQPAPKPRPAIAAPKVAAEDHLVHEPKKMFRRPAE
jgi:hypothetical protein